MKVAHAIKHGCLGVLGLAILTVVIVGLLTGVALLQGKPSVHSTALLHPVPRTGSTVPATPIRSPDSGAMSGPEATSGALEAPVTLAGEPGRILIDTNLADVVVEPGTPGEPLRVEAVYDTKTYVLEGHAGSYGEAGWTYRVGFRPVGWVRFVVQRTVFHGEQPEIRVVLPRGAPLVLEGKINRGSANLRLGGLWLTDVDLVLRRGGQRLRFDEPLPVRPERLTVRSRMGNLRVTDLGNASPQTTSIDSVFGGVDLDLGGVWKGEAAIDVRCRMGGCFVHPTADAVLVGLESHGYSPPPDASGPRLDLSVESDDAVRIGGTGH